MYRIYGDLNDKIMTTSNGESVHQVTSAVHSYGSLETVIW